MIRITPTRITPTRTIRGRRIRAVLLAMAGVAFASAPALAQTTTLPDVGRSQGSANAINNSLAAQSEIRTQQQQNQFEINSLRNQPLQSVTPPPAVTVSPIR